jgi:hypothetical protein
MRELLGCSHKSLRIYLLVVAFASSSRGSLSGDSLYVYSAIFRASSDSSWKNCTIGGIVNVIKATASGGYRGLSKGHRRKL